MNKVIYLDNAATSFPKPAQVIKETTNCIKYFCVNSGRGSHEKSRYANEIVFHTREQLAELFNIDTPERIAYTLNATQAINQGLQGVLKNGDGLVISSMEHNSVLRPCVYLGKQGIKLEIAQASDDGEVTFANIKPHLTPSTKMVALIHASNVTGRINNITEIGRELKKKNIVFLVDAAQSAGSVPINVRDSHIDILCFPGHKGLMGPTGTGGIYVSPEIDISPLMQGGTGSMSESKYQPQDMPDLLESGTLNILGISALSKGLEFVKDNFKEITEHEKLLSDRLAENLANIKGVTVLGRSKGKNTGIVSVKLESMAPAAAAFYLDRDYRIATRAGFHCSYLASKTLGATKDGTLRFSVGPFNTSADIEKASHALFKTLLINK